MADRLTISCPKCQQKLSIPEIPSSIKITCPKCNTEFTYPFERTTEKKHSWLSARIKAHPVVTALVITYWLFQTVISRYNWNVLSLLINTAFSFGIWLFLCWFIDSMQDKTVKWFYRKGFVVLMLIIFAPIGIALTWSGAKFKVIAKVFLTVCFGFSFVMGIIDLSNENIYYSPLDVVSVMMNRPKERTFIGKANPNVLRNLKAEMKLRRHEERKRKLSIPQIAKKWGNAIVLIEAIDKRGNILSQGSGFIISKDGIIVTNYHVVEGAYKAMVSTVGGSYYDNLLLVETYPQIDIALLKLLEKKTFSPLILGNSDDVQVGEQVVAIGNPLGLENSVSDGVISGIREVEDIQLLQTTASISPGSSGGALFNMYGEVVGVTTLGSFWEAQNVNFAIPINSLTSRLEE